MRTITQFLGLGLLSSMVLALPSCADDNDSDTSTGDEADSTTPTTGTTNGSTSSSTSGPPTTSTSGGETSGETTTTDTTATTTSSTSVGTESTSGSTDGSTTTTETGEGTDTESSESEDSTDSTDTTGDDEGSSTTTTTTGDDGGDTTTTETGSDTDPNDELLHELTDTICDWAYNCCEVGEIDYILGPFVEDEEDCSTRLYNLLAINNDNSVEEDEQKLKHLGNEYQELAFSLAYRIRLDRSESIEDGLKGCIQAWKDDSCREPKKVREDNCTDDPISRACQLDKMFVGKLGQNEFCNHELSGPHTDIECAPGFTCEADQSLPDDPQNYRCVFKGDVGDLCTPSDDASNNNCEYGLYCDADTGRCAQRAQHGQSCKYSSTSNPVVGEMEVPCDHDLYCDPKEGKCVAECEEGYACGPRLKANRIVESRPAGPGLSDDFILQYPTPNNDSPMDLDDRCGDGLSCTPYRNDRVGKDSAKKPGDEGFYFGRGDDRYGTSFECRKPGDDNVLCDTDADCEKDSYCEPDPIELPPRRTGGGNSGTKPHHHDVSDTANLFANVGRCRPRLDTDDECVAHVASAAKDPGDPTDDLDASTDFAANLAELRDSRCPLSDFCDVEGTGTDNNRFVGGACTPKKRVNDTCERHDECDPNLTAGLCVATNDGSNGMAEDDETKKRCVAHAIREGALCAPGAGLGTYLPFPIQNADEKGPGDDRALTADFWDNGGSAHLAGIPGELLPVVDLEFPGADIGDGGILPFWQGPHFPFVDSGEGHITSYPWSPMYQAMWSADLGDVDKVGGVPGLGGNENADPDEQIIASGGEWKAYAFMQGQAMQLRRDLDDYLANHPTPASGVAADSPANDDDLWRSDFRYLASHCGDNGKLVCKRDEDDAEGGYRFKCLEGGIENDDCDNDPGTFGPGYETCAPGFVCHERECKPEAKTGESCVTKDTGDDTHKRIARCDWRHRIAKTACVPCPDAGKDQQTCSGGCLVDPETGDEVHYITEYDNGCEKVHNASMCRLITEEATDAAYCDGIDSNN